ncbi:MAG TPA: GNAT family N-acetyltransferase [Flavisolibacter sp.]|nr:GNAT family N-acetyltransferase [Flavisolibacter sp.]
MVTLIKTDSTHPDFHGLIIPLDKELQALYGEEQAFFDQFNKVNMIRHVVIAYNDGRPVGCGAIKEFDADTMEVKRMFVDRRFRGQGIALQVLSALEQWAGELGYKRCVLETGNKQKEAIRLYEKAGYRVIANYGQYVGVASSICMEKPIR